MKSLYLPIGELSSGTLRKEDLFPTLLDAMNGVRLGRENRKLINEIRCNTTKEDYYDSEQADCDMEALMDIMNEACPPYCFFGALEGDGACFGVWPSVDSAEDVPRFEAGVELPKDFFGEFLFVNDHGNVDFGIKHRNGHVKLIWSVV